MSVHVISNIFFKWIYFNENQWMCHAAAQLVCIELCGLCSRFDEFRSGVLKCMCKVFSFCLFSFSCSAAVFYDSWCDFVENLACVSCDKFYIDFSSFFAAFESDLIADERTVIVVYNCFLLWTVFDLFSGVAFSLYSEEWLK